MKKFAGLRSHKTWNWAILREGPTVWPDMESFRHCGQILEYFGSLSKVFLVFGQILKPLWQNFYAIGQIFVIVIVQM